MTFFDELSWGDKVLKWAERQPGTHFSNSRVPGADSALLRDDDENLVGHAPLFPVGSETLVAAAVCVLAGIILDRVVIKAAPRVKNRFNGLRTKLNRTPEDITIAATDQEARPEQSDSEIEEPPSGNRHLCVA